MLSILTFYLVIASIIASRIHVDHSFSVNGLGVRSRNMSFLGRSAASEDATVLYRRTDVATDFDAVIEAHDLLNGVHIASAVTTGNVAAAAAPNYNCYGLCCSSNVVSYPKSTKLMLSRWLTNAMYQNARVHIWTWQRNSYWGPANQRASVWAGRLAAFPNQGLKSATNSITTLRLSSTTVRLRVPGGNYIEARNNNRVYFNPSPVAGTVFKFIPVGSGHVQFFTVFRTYLSVGSDNYIYHWKVTPGKWETFLIYEVKAVPAFRGVNLGSWLIPEYWMAPDLWNNVPTLVDGFQFQMQSVVSNKWVTTVYNKLQCTGKTSSSGSIFVLRRVNGPNSKVEIRNQNTGGYTVLSGTSLSVSGTLYPNAYAQFTLYVDPNGNRVKLQAQNGKFVRVSNGNLYADTPSFGKWNDATTFTLSQTGAIITTYQLCSGLGRAGCAAVLSKHWSTWITESDWQWISSQGLNAVRLPIPYWITQQYPDYPFPAGGYKYLDWAFQMAVKYRIRIFISMHSAPYSNNNIETRDGFYEFSQISGSVETMLAAIDWVSRRYSSNAMFAGINLINEPYDTVALGTLLGFYTKGIAALRKYSKCAYVSYIYRFGGTSPLEYKVYPSFPLEASNVIQDQHQYKVYDSMFYGKTIAQLAKAVYVNDTLWLRGVEQGNFWIAMVGEFSNSVPLSVPVYSAYEPYATAEMVTYGEQTQGGWFFWSYKISPNYISGWGFRFGVENGYIRRKNGIWP